MHASIRKALDAEKEVALLLDSLKSELTDMVCQQRQPNVKQVSETITAGTVFFSALGRGLNLSPKFYLQEGQASSVAKRVAACKSMDALCSAVTAMLIERKVKLPDETVCLNDASVEAVRQSVIGQYVTECENKIS